MGKLSCVFFRLSKSITDIFTDINSSKQKETLIYLLESQMRLKLQEKRSNEKSHISQKKKIRRILGSECSFILRGNKNKLSEDKHIWTFRKRFSCIYIVAGGKFIEVYANWWMSPDVIHQFIYEFHDMIKKDEIKHLLSRLDNKN